MRRVEDEIVLLDSVRSSYLAANPSAAVLWDGLAAGTDRQHLIDRLVDTYDIDREQAGRDVDRFVRALEELGLLDE